MQIPRRSKSGKQRTLSQSRRFCGLNEILCPGDVLLVVPPFASLSYPSYAVHLLQACGRQSGFRVQVLYANLVLAGLIGEITYARICDAPMGSFAGERFFARWAYGVPTLGRHANRMLEPSWVVAHSEGPEIEPIFAYEEPISLAELKSAERYAESFLDTVAKAICKRSYKIVGCTTSFEQTAAAVSLLNRIKRLDRRTVTILGGANCEGEMASGIASVAASIDFVFSGESEATFVDFVGAILAGDRPAGSIVQGHPCRELDILPTPVFTDFYEQRRQFLPQSPVANEDTQIPYESSRGCWWGEKHHCTFCGLNGGNIAFRQKSSDRVIEELRSLLAAHPTRCVMMLDNIMPNCYFKTLLPRLTAELPEHSIFYEQRSNLSLAGMLALKRAGVESIQPGIEALSSRLLKLIGKGTKAAQNLTSLRYARAVGIRLSWNFLWGFPGDKVEWYEDVLEIVPLLHHLPPPDGLMHVGIERFSPYFLRPEYYGLRNVKPMTGYYDFLPKNADVNRFAYHFMADYESGAHMRIDVIRKLARELEEWHATWSNATWAPSEDLRICVDHGRYLLIDTRRVAGAKKTFVLDERGACSLAGTRSYAASPFETWALQNKLAVVVDGLFVPLPIADPELFLMMEQRNCAPKATGLD